MRNQYEFAVIQQVMDGQLFDEPQSPCKITVLGGSPQATVRASRFDRETGNFEDLDRLLACEIVEHPDGTITFTGQSENLDILHALPEGQRTVVWQVQVKGCQGC